MQRSIELYNKLHECCREALSISEANAEGCNFYDNEATQKAFEDFKRDYGNFCEEQNTVEGEPFTQEPPNIAHYLTLHKATKRVTNKDWRYRRRHGVSIRAPKVEKPAPTAGASKEACGGNETDRDHSEGIGKHHDKGEPQPL